jgi:phage integrase family protein
MGFPLFLRFSPNVFNFPKNNYFPKSEALTHSDKEITKTYVNTKDKVNQTVGDIAFRSLKN